MFATCLDYDSSSRSSAGSPGGESFRQYPSALGSYCSLNSPGSQSQASKLLEPATAFSKQAPFAATPALGNSSTAAMSELDASLEESLDLLESLRSTAVETSQAVPDIDLSSSFYTQDWEPLYTPAMGDLEPLCTPVVTCTPACTTYASTFTYPEAEPLATCRGAHQRESGNSDQSSDSRNPPTLVSL
ncbi:hypothetical protein Z043_121756 [Scleropages formosus]|uniref:Uncharacterized protein n=1 Tax=Scleropages formosus TaxID=113540 RepID=A0A0P7TR69_SCLFO|nr:hypothetical protein Z043_121756 [Scleropages formosus]